MKILIYDQDSNYVKRVSSLLAEIIGSEFEIHCCNCYQDIDVEIKNKGIDILLIEEKLWLEYSEKAEDVLVILLCNELITYSDKKLNYIYKYQSIRTIAKSITDMYLEYEPTVISLNARKLSKLVVIYSPIGGSGKTTISLALTHRLVQMGLKALYLNLELFASDKSSAKERGGLSNLLKLAHQNKPLDLEAQTIVKTQKIYDYKYIPSVDSIYDLTDYEKSDFSYLINQLKESRIAEAIIIDCDSYYSDLTKNLIDLADIVYLVNIDKMLSNVKFQSFKYLTSYYQKFLPKTKFILNKSSQSGKSEYILIPDYGNIDDQQIIQKISKSVDFDSNLA
ncbi:MAG: hypothetical protein ACLFPS_02290 [Clostridia bacterium]